jgi:hypothetical protein
VAFYLAERIGGDPLPLQVEAVAWVEAAELGGVDFIPANREIVDRLRTDLERGGGIEPGGGEGDPKA